MKTVKAPTQKANGVRFLSFQERENLGRLARSMWRIFGSQSRASRALGLSQGIFSSYCRNRRKICWLSLKTCHGFEGTLRSTIGIEPCDAGGSFFETLLVLSPEKLAPLEKIYSQVEISVFLRKVLSEKIPTQEKMQEQEAVDICWSFLLSFSLCQRERILEEMRDRVEAERLVSKYSKATQN